MSSKQSMVSKTNALNGRADPLFKVNEVHSFLKSKTIPPFPSHTKWLIVGMGCFWGAERLFWKMKGVGYCGGFTPNPTYEETCSTQTGHAEVVRIVYEPAKLTLNDILKVFWEKHDPTTPNRQGNDVGSQYRSALYLPNESDLQIAVSSKDRYQAALGSSRPICTELTVVDGERDFYYAEDYHQQYLHKNPGGYCNLKGTGVVCVE